MRVALVGLLAGVAMILLGMWFVGLPPFPSTLCGSMEPTTACGQPLPQWVIITFVGFIFVGPVLSVVSLAVLVLRRRRTTPLDPSRGQGLTQPERA